MKYRSVTATRRGSPEVLRTEEHNLRAPRTGEVRIRTLAAGVCLPDVTARYGQTPVAPRTPFVPGYAIIGTVDAPGQGVTTVAAGDRVAALSVFGGYAEYIYLPEEELIPVPEGLNPAEAVTVVLNYLVAFQVLHRRAKVKAGDKVLIVGASGGVGTALLQLGKLAGLKMYGLASRSKHSVVTALGATPIDYHSQDWCSVVREAEPDGLDAVFDGIGGHYIDQGYSLLRRGGRLVEYGNPLSLRRLLVLLAKVALLTALPNGRSVKLYSTSVSKFNRRPFLEDWATLFRLLRERKIRPIIQKRFPILEAAQANELLEGGQVIGNIVLPASEWL